MQAEALIENVGYPDYIVDTEYMARKYKEVCLDPIFYIFCFVRLFFFGHGLTALWSYGKTPIDTTECMHCYTFYVFFFFSFLNLTGLRTAREAPNGWLQKHYQEFKAFSLR